jgi:hypothetical protein
MAKAFDYVIVNQRTKSTKDQRIKYDFLGNCLIGWITQTMSGCKPSA